MNNYNYSDIHTFWFGNQKYWIAIKDKDKELIDKSIYENYFNINNLDDILQIDISEFDNKSLIGFIIYYDQFYRHFMRYENKNNIKSHINEDLIFKQIKYYL